MSVKKLNKVHKNSRIHLMGIGGSGLSGVAVIAKKHGFDVTGCDLEKDTPYLTKVKKAGIKINTGHSIKHLENKDLLVVSPAVIYQNKNHPEYSEAYKKGIVKTWDQFMGENLLENKKVICIAGTHGKSTVTALTGLVFEAQGVDPNVLVGATVKEWQANYRVGKSDLFILESDEFYEKFLNYKPQVIIINNIEFDHPDYFKNEKEVINSFKKFTQKLQEKMILILNLDSAGVLKMYNSLDRRFISKIRIYGYTLQSSAPFKVQNTVFGSIAEKSADYTSFSVFSEKLGLNDVFRIKIPGEYNVSNTLGIITLAKIYNLDKETLKKVLLSFDGIGRRLEEIGEKKGVYVYDDYAHHPTAVKATISAIKQKYPSFRLLVVMEPHSYSRTHALLKYYNGVFDDADYVIVGPIFKARDTGLFGVTSTSIVNISGHKNIVTADGIQDIIKKVKQNITGDSVILVMGAGYSYKWSREILKAL